MDACDGVSPKNMSASSVVDIPCQFVNALRFVLNSLKIECSNMLTYIYNQPSRMIQYSGYLYILQNYTLHYKKSLNDIVTNNHYISQHFLIFVLVDVVDEHMIRIIVLTNVLINV